MYKSCILFMYVLQMYVGMDECGWMIIIHDYHS
jgi:hypothetical protein